MKHINITTEFTLNIDDESVVVEIKAGYIPGVAGRFYRRNGDPGDPPEPPEIDIESIVEIGGKERTFDFDKLSKVVQNSICDKIHSEYQDN